MLLLSLRAHTLPSLFLTFLEGEERKEKGHQHCCTGGDTLEYIVNIMYNRNNTIEYQLPRYFVLYSKVFSYLPSLSFNSNITSLLNSII